MTQHIQENNQSDSIFTSLFQDKKYILQVYKDIHPEDVDVSEEDIADVSINHLEGALENNYHNVSFTVHNRIMLIMESASIWEEDLLLYAIMYTLKVMDVYFGRVDQENSGIEKAPMPEIEAYIMDMTDDNRKPSRTAVILSDGEEFTVSIGVNIVRDENEQELITQYILFSKMFRKNRVHYGDIKQAITETIQTCKDRNILKEYFENNAKEAVKIMLEQMENERIRQESKAESDASQRLMS